MYPFSRLAFVTNYVFSLLTKKCFEFVWRFTSKTTLCWNFPQTFCVLNQQPSLLLWQILCALSIDTFERSPINSKPAQTVPSVPSHLKRWLPPNLTNTCPKDLRVTCPDAAKKAWQERWVKQANKRKQRNFFVSQTSPPKTIASSTNHVYVQVCQKNPVIWSFGLQYFACLPFPNLLLIFTRGHKEVLIRYEELCWTKQYDWEGVFVERAW